MAFIFDLSCYTVCFCIILTITRNTWLAVSFLPCSLSPSLSPSRSVVHLSPLSRCTCWIQCAHVWCTEMDWHCMCRHGHLHPWAAWVGRCLCLLCSTISFVFFKCVDCCWICLFTCGGEGRSQPAVICQPKPRGRISLPKETLSMLTCWISTCINWRSHGLNELFAYKYLGSLSLYAWQWENSCDESDECHIKVLQQSERGHHYTHDAHTCSCGFSLHQSDAFNTLIHDTCTCKPSAALISTFREAIRSDLAYSTHIKIELQSASQWRIKWEEHNEDGTIKQWETTKQTT